MGSIETGRVGIDGAETDNVNAGRGAVPQWLEVDVAGRRGVVRGLPLREDIQIPVTEQLIVELYSK